MELQPAADVLQAFLAECELKLVQFAPQNLSNMLWACATLGVSTGMLPRRLSSPQSPEPEPSYAKHTAMLSSLFLDRSFWVSGF